MRALAKLPKRRLREIGWHRDTTCGTKCLRRSRAAHDVAGRRKITEHRQRDLPCPALPQKIIRFRRRANQFYQLAPSHPGKRGVSRSSRTRDGMRWTRQRRRARWSQGGLIRERSPARRTNGAGCVRQNRVVPTPVAGAKPAEAKSTQPSLISLNPPTTVTRRIRRRGEHGISRKAIAQGK